MILYLLDLIKVQLCHSEQGDVVWTGEKCTRKKMKVQLLSIRGCLCPLRDMLTIPRTNSELLRHISVFYRDQKAEDNHSAQRGDVQWPIHSQCLTYAIIRHHVRDNVNAIGFFVK